MSIYEHRDESGRQDEWDKAIASLTQLESSVRRSMPVDEANAWVSNNISPIERQYGIAGASDNLLEAIRNLQLPVEITESIDEGEEASSSYVDQG